MKEPRQVRIRFYEDNVFPPGYYLNSLLYVNNEEVRMLIINK